MSSGAMPMPDSVLAAATGADGTGGSSYEGDGDLPITFGEVSGVSAQTAASAAVWGMRNPANTNSDSDSDDDSDGESEEREHLVDETGGLPVRLFDAGTQAQMRAAMEEAISAQAAPQSETAAQLDLDAMVQSIQGTMEKMKIAPPRLENTLAALTVQFWRVDLDGTATEMLAQTKEIWILEDRMRDICNTPSLKPQMAQWTIDDEDEDEEEEEDVVPDNANGGDDIVPDSGPAASADAEAEDPDSEEEDLYDTDEDEPNYIDPKGIVNVILSLHGQSSVYVGILSQEYDVDSEPSSGRVISQRSLKRMAEYGNPVSWIGDSTGNEHKRSRASEDGSAAAAESEPAAAAASPDAYTHAFSNFSEEDQSEWTSTRNLKDVICAFTRNNDTGKLVKVRLAVHLESPRMRAELQDALAQSLDTI